MTLTEHPHGGAFDLNAGGAIEVHGELFIGPVGAVESTTLRALYDPLVQGGGKGLGNAPRLTRGPLNRQTWQAMLLIPVEPLSHGGAMHADVLGDGLALSTSAGHQDRLATIPQSTVGSGFEGVFEFGLFFKG